jgi:exopolysaccharide production repressor protein
MYFQQFLVGICTTSALMALWTYLATGSFWKALAWTILTLIVLQAGYLVLVVRLVFKRSPEGAEANLRSVSPAPPLGRDGEWF